jgi:hypothetical protein
MYERETIMNRKDVRASVVAFCKELDAQRISMSRSVETEKLQGNILTKPKLA